ncbi:F-box only protein 42 [Culicoides brevitarsis]|uniref:F-box only protein 42 n=1 Tax=Culicoides brevitarsis TaxID=469753 RepID=UPI00307B962B
MAHILQLPDEIIEYILDNLPPYRDLENCKEVCQRWFLLVENVFKHKKLSLNKGLLEYNLLWKTYCLGNRNPKLIPAPRYAHSSIVIGNFMYVFGGSSVGGAFNDLWSFNLSSREWSRPVSMGNYPNPKANSSLVRYRNTLILFGGWRQTSGNTHQPHLLFNELHCYDLEERRWTIKNFSYGPNPTAAHTATVHRDKMVVFGGFSRLENDVQGTTNEVWYLDLKTFVWRKPKILDKKPTARYGHFQVVIDDDTLMMMGGCGGPNNLFSDAWTLNMAGDVWKWEPITIKNKKFTANHMWCNPAAIIDQKLVIIGPTPAQPIDLKIPKQQLGVNRPIRMPNNLPPEVNGRPQQRISAENQRNELPPPANPPPASPPRVNSFNDEALRLQRSLCIRSSQQNSFDPTLPRRFNEPIIHGTIKMAAFNVEKNSQLPQQIQRERQLENLRRMEIKIQRERNNKRREEEASKKTKRPKTNCLAIFVCDFSGVSSAAASSSIEWMEYKNFGLFEGAPEKKICSSMVAGTGELILFGGLQRETTSETATNAIHFLTYPSTVL